MNPQVDAYLLDGCGRCELYATPECKVHNWREEIILLRTFLLETELREEYKWSQPCYTYNGNNVIMLSALKNHAVLSFFKGVLLNDEKNLLDAPGENSQADRLFRITSVEQVQELEPFIKSYIQEAIELEKAGKKVAYKKELEPVPEEFQRFLDNDPELKNAYDALTPGRKRGYILYFSSPKQSKTRVSRIEKYIPKILSGKGFHDR